MVSTKPPEVLPGIGNKACAKMVFADAMEASTANGRVNFANLQRIVARSSKLQPQRYNNFQGCDPRFALLFRGKVLGV